MELKIVTNGLESLLSSANITIGSANIEMGDIGQQGLPQQGDEIKEGEITNPELSSELMDDTKKLLDDPSLGLTDEQKEEYMADPQKLADDLPGMKRNLTNAIKGKGDVGNLISSIDGAIGERMQNSTAMDDEDGDPHADKRQRVRDLLSGSIRGKANKNKFDFVTSHADGRELEELEEIGEMKSKRKLMDKVSSGLKDSGYQSPTIGASNKASEGAATIGSMATGAANKQGIGNIAAGNITINASSVNMQGGGNIKFAGDGQVKAIEGTTKTEKEEKSQNSQPAKVELDDEITLTGASLSAGEIFKNIGGLEQLGKLGVELYQGLGGIGDGLYVDGDAPTRERETIAQMLNQNIKDSSDKRKENTDRMKDNWAHNKANISIMTDKYMSDKKFTDQYSDKPEAYIRRKAEEKAKSALKDMSEYVPYGVTDVKLAYELYDSANKNAFTPEQAIRNKVGYEQFNNNVQNVVSINNSGTFERNNYTTVEEAIPNARTYYDAGYTNINDMAWVEKIAQSLGRSPEFAMKVDQTLRKKGGKINYSGKNEEMKKLIEDINSTYGG